MKVASHELLVLRYAADLPFRQGPADEMDLTEARISSKKCKVIIPLPTLTHAFDATFILIVPMKVTSHELS